MAVKVKICGVTNPEDAEFAISEGVDYVGLIFAKSRRKIIKETAKRITETVPSFENWVGVFLNQKKKEIEDICNYAGIKIIQLHGDETPAFCNYFVNRGIKVIKAVHIKDKSYIDVIKRYNKRIKFLFDTFKAGEYGGTGKPFDWKLLLDEGIVKEKDFFLSGGLDENNVVEALKLVSPYGVDASSRLEAEVGIKDKAKVKAFIRAVKAV